MNKIKYIIIVLILTITTGCLNYIELNDIGIINTIGINKKEEKYIIDINMLTPTINNSEENTTYEVIANTLEEAFDKLYLLTSKNINLSHLELILLSKNLNSNDYDNITKFFLNRDDSRNTFPIIIVENYKSENIFKHTAKEINSLIETNSKDDGIVSKKTFDELAEDIININISYVPTIKIDENIIVIIEMQLEDKCKMDKRAIYYASKIMASSLESGQTYNQIKNMYVISILDYNMLETEEYNTDTVIVDSKYRKYVVIDGIKFYFIELPKFREQIRKPKTKLEEWLTFIDYENREMVKMAIAQNKLVEKAQKEYEYLTGDEATKRWKFLREKAILDERAAFINGKKETAKAMIKDKVKRELIEKYTGLDRKELEEIYKKEVSVR